MTFASPFSGVIQRPFGGVPSRAAPVIWWLEGSISAANCIAAYQPKGAASYAASKVNLANPGTYDAVDGAAYPSWGASTGWTGNGTSQYIDTGVVIANGWSAIIRLAMSGALLGRAFSVNTEGLVKSFGIAPRWTNNSAYFNYGGYAGVSFTGTSGVFAITGETGCYIDGVDVANTKSAYSDINTRPLYVLAGNEGSAVAFWAGSVLAMAIYDISLSSTQVGLLTTSMNAL